MKKFFILIFLFFSTNVYSDNLRDPFYKDLKNEVLKRHSLSSASPYSVQSLKLVATCALDHSWSSTIPSNSIGSSILIGL